MKSISPIKKTKVLQTFGNGTNFYSSGLPKKQISSAYINRKINFFLIQLDKLFNFFFLLIFSISAFSSKFIKYNFFGSFHHKFLQSLLLLDKFSYNNLTHTNLSLEKRHGTKNSTWIFA